MALPKLLVGEVAAYHLDRGRSFRQAARFVRWRLDREPRECRIEDEPRDKYSFPVTSGQ
jgi:ATP-dependent DNA ligase